MDVGDLSSDKVNEVAYMDGTKEAILPRFQCVLVDAGRRYRIQMDVNSAPAAPGCPSYQ